MQAKNISYQAGTYTITLALAGHKQCPVQQTVPMAVKNASKNDERYQAGTYTIRLTKARHKQYPVQQRMPVAAKQCYQRLKARITYTIISMRKHSSGHRKLFLSDAGLTITRTLEGRRR